MRTELYIVDSLDPECLLDGLKNHDPEVHRLVVFSVAGVIDLGPQAGLDMPDIQNVTINGHTAPGDGISIRNAPLYLVNARNVRLHDLHFHLGVDPSGRGRSWSPLRIVTHDGGLTENIVIDRCTFTGGEDEQISCTPLMQAHWQEQWPDKPHIRGLVISNCRFNPSYTLNRGNHNFACMVSLADDVHIFKNCFMHQNRRNPQVQGTSIIVRQNVIYNYGTGAIMCMAPGDYRITQNICVLGPNSRTTNPVAPITIQPTGTTGDVVLTHGGNERVKYGSVPYAIDLPVDNQTDNPLTDNVDPDVERFNRGWYVAHRAGARLDELDQRLINEYKTLQGGWCKTPDDHGGFPDYEYTFDDVLTRYDLRP